MDRMKKRWSVVLLTGGSLTVMVAVASLLIVGKLYLAEKKIGYCFDVALGSSRIYVAAGKAGLHVLDVSEGTLKYALTYHDRGYYRNLKIAGDRAYVAEGDRGLVVLDITKDSPTVVWEQMEAKGAGIHIENDKAYLAASRGGLYIFDIANPNVPRPLVRFEDLEDAWDVWVHDSFAYVADLDKGLSVIDVSSPAHPYQAGFVTWSQENPSAEIVRGEGNAVYVAAAHHGLVVVDITDPTRPAIASIYQSDPDNWAEGLAVREGIVYLAIGNKRSKKENGLYIIDARNPYSLSTIGKVHFPDWVEGVHVAGDYAYVANTFAGVRSLDVRHLDRPVLVDTFDLTDWIVHWLR